MPSFISQSAFFLHLHAVFFFFAKTFLFLIFPAAPCWTVFYSRKNTNLGCFWAMKQRTIDLLTHWSMCMKLLYDPLQMCICKLFYGYMLHNVEVRIIFHNSFFLIFIMKLNKFIQSFFLNMQRNQLSNSYIEIYRKVICL